MIALIIGVFSQDGIYLSRYLSDLGYVVYGTTRYTEIPYEKINSVQCKISRLNPVNSTEVDDIISTIKPDHIYVLAAQSSVSESFKDPFSTIMSNTSIVMNVLNSVVKFAPKAKVMNASSSEVFGNSKQLVNSSVQFQPVSPYGLSKAVGADYVRMYVDMYNLHAVNLFLYNHESKYRPAHFVTKKIINYVNAASNGIVNGPLKLGNIEIERDWGLAEEYIVPMVKALFAETPMDCVICTGSKMSLRQFVDHAFAYYGMQASDYLEFSHELKRKHEIFGTRGDPSEALEKLSWSADTIGPRVIEKLLEDDRQK